MSSIVEQKRAVDLSVSVQQLKDKLGALKSADFGSKQIVRVTADVDSEISLFDWLSSRVFESKIYWSDRSGSYETAGAGECLLFESDNFDGVESTISQAVSVLKESDSGLRVFGGIRFPSIGSNGYSSDWQEFRSCRFVIPRFELTRQENKFTLTCNIKSEELNDFLKVTNQIDSVLAATESNNSGGIEIADRQDEPNYDGWSGNIRAIIEDFSNGKVEKIVLARQTSIMFKDSCNALALLNRLTDSTPNCYHYYFQPKTSVAFLGASPEQLYSRHRQQIASEALAGTRPRGKTSTEDLQLGDELLHNEKELREHNFVVENIKSALSQICAHHSEKNATRLLKLNLVQHLQTRFNGTLKDNVSDAAIIKLLHPTSAVGGYPSDLAQSRIADCEPFDRGWYAGVVGWLAKDSAEFAVAIRSGLVRDNQLKLFSGAGIVQGSTPEAEWAEIESKIGSFLSAVTG